MLDLPSSWLTNLKKCLKGISCCNEIVVKNQYENSTIFAKTGEKNNELDVYVPVDSKSTKAIWYTGWRWVYGEFANITDGPYQFGDMFPSLCTGYNTP